VIHLPIKAAMSFLFQTDPRKIQISLADLCCTLKAPIALCSCPEFQQNGRNAMKTVEQLRDKLDPNYANKVISIVDFMGSTSGEWTAAKIRSWDGDQKMLHESDFEIDFSSTEEFGKYFAKYRQDFHEKASGDESQMKSLATTGFAISQSQWNSYWRGKVAGGLTMALSTMEPTSATAETLHSIGLGYNGMDLSELRFAIAVVIDGGPVTQQEQREMTQMVDEVVYDLRRRGPSWAKNAGVLLVHFPDVESFIKSLQGDKNLIRTSRFPTRQRDTCELEKDIFTQGFAWETTASAGYGQRNILQVSFEHALQLKEKPDPDMLFQMADSGDTIGVKRLLDMKCSIPEAITHATGFNALHASAYQGFADTTKLLLEAMQYDPSYKDQAPHGGPNSGVTATFLAANHNKLEVLETLLQFRVNVDKPDREGVTPLYIASAFGNAKAVEMLLNAKCDVHKSQKDGCCPAYIAAECQQLEIMKMLMQHGGDINQQRNDGVTPLIFASSKGNVETVRFLIQAKAQVNTYKGKTPLQCAEKAGHRAIVSLLQQ